MANTGIKRDAWAAVQKSGGGDWTALAVIDNANAGSGAIAFATKTSVKIGYSLTAGAGAIDGLVTIYVLNEVADGDYQIYPDDPAYSFQIEPAESKTIRDWFTLHADEWGDSVKIWMLNESGQSLTTTFKFQTADVPVAS